MLEEYPDILTTDEACEYLRMGYNALYDLLNSGKLAGIRNGRKSLIPKAAIQDFIFSYVSSGQNRNGKLKRFN